MKKLTAEQQATIVKRYAEGHSLRMIATQMGVSYGSVHRLVKASPVDFRPRGGSHA